MSEYGLFESNNEISFKSGANIAEYAAGGLDIGIG
jgi:hypothetical protein